MNHNLETTFAEVIRRVSMLRIRRWQETRKRYATQKEIRKISAG